MSPSIKHSMDKGVFQDSAEVLEILALSVKVK